MSFQDRDYEENLRKFYEGTWLIAGWNQRKDKLLVQFDPHQQRLLGERLDRIGQRVAPEWARKDGRVSSLDLKDWGSQLQKAVSGGFERLVAALEQLEELIENRLNGRF
ncbi:MAG: hypothetical protein HYV63_33415 [Candidatus Schekmanbacteria bacterium]|nr:hypothetical protein [Candidatus Schekmanbacteria bacterium]